MSRSVLLFTAAFLVCCFALEGQEILPAEHPYLVEGDALRPNATLSWLDGLTANTNFGGWTGDHFFEYYVPASGGYIESVELHLADLPDVDGGSLAISIFPCEYGWDEIAHLNVTDACVDAQLGYYDETDGYSIVGSNWVQGGINQQTGVDPNYNYDPLGQPPWPEDGPILVDLVPNFEDADTLIIELIQQGLYYELEEDTPIAVVIELVGFPGSGDLSEHRTGFMTAQTSFELPPALKFYNVESSPSGRCGQDDWGWYMRSYTWDWRIHVEYTSGPRPPYATFTNFESVLDTSEQLIEVEWHYEYPPVDPGLIHYQVNGGEWLSVETHAYDGDPYRHYGHIPGQATGSEVTYWLSATFPDNVEGSTLESSYHVFLPLSEFLFLYDESVDHGINREDIWPEIYGHNMPSDTNEAGEDVEWDIWFGHDYGPYTPELLEHYLTIYYVMGMYPADMPQSEVLKDWILAATAEQPRNLMITGQDYGWVSSWEDTVFADGSFERDFLGIESFLQQDYTNGSTGLHPIDPVYGHPLSTFLAYPGGQLSYFPRMFEHGINWLDIMTVTEDASIFLTDTENDNAPLAWSMSGEHWKTAYSQVDFYCMNMREAASSTFIYNNITEDLLNPFDPVFRWFDTPSLSIHSNPGIMAADFALKPAYPNPFNPEVNFEFAVGWDSHVKISLYDPLGRVVEVLWDRETDAGAYLVEWRAHDEHASGVYFLRMVTEDFKATIKFVLLK